MQTFLVQVMMRVLIEASKNEDIRNFVADQVKRLKDDLLPDLSAINLASGAAMLKDVFNKLPGVPDISKSVGEIATGAIETIKNDPDLPGVSDKIDLSELATSILNRFGL